jgi:uncharacterized short protein YbdD (DUF466 family)
MRKFLAALRRIAGMPDYARYLEHRARCHPGETTMTEREFYDRYLETRYGGAGSRCC